MCRGSEDGGRRCPSCSSAAGRQAHNARRRQNRAIRRAVVEWAQQQGFDAAEVALLATSSPSAAKQWAADHQAPSEVFDAPERVQSRKRLPKVPTAAVIGQPEAFGFLPASEIRRSPSKSDLADWKAEARSWIGSLNGEELRVVEEYTGADASEFNDELRDNPNASPADAPDTRILYESVTRAPLAPAPRTLLRGVYSPAEGRAAMSEWARRRFPVGATWMDRGFLSTTRTTLTAVSFASDGVVFELRSRRGVCLSELSRHPHEMEYLLAPGTRWRVVGHAEEVAYDYGRPGHSAVMRRSAVFLVDEEELGRYSIEGSGDAPGFPGQA